MSSGIRLALAVGAGAAALGIWILVRVRRWRRRDPAELERLRRLDVNRRGRITAGRVTDQIEHDDHQPGVRLVLYQYEVAGVTYDAAQDVSTLGDFPSGRGNLAGQTASVKYDPRMPTNSIIACEDWCGVGSETK